MPICRNPTGNRWLPRSASWVHGSMTKCAGSCERREIVNNSLFDTIQPTCESGCADHPQGKEASHLAEIYIPTEQYRAAVNAIAAMTDDDPDEIKIALFLQNQKGAETAPGAVQSPASLPPYIGYLNSSVRNGSPRNSKSVSRPTNISSKKNSKNYVSR